MRMGRGILLLCAVLLPSAAQAACIALGANCANTSASCCPPGVYSDPAQKTGCKCIVGLTTTTVVATTTTATIQTSTSTTLTGSSTTVVSPTTTTLPTSQLTPIVITAQDVSLRVRGGFDYTEFRGHAPNQYERDQMEQALLGQWMPRVVALLATLPRCADTLRYAFGPSTLNAITPRLEAVHQYEGRTYPPTRQTWLVKSGGNFYEILGYILQHAHACALSDPVAAATSPAMTTDVADLLDLSCTADRCTDGATFVPAYEPPMGALETDGLVDGKHIFPPLSATDEALRKTAIAAHLGGECGQTAAGSVQAAQRAFEASAGSLDEMHFRTAQPFIGGCAAGMSTADCCAWRALEHREYVACANAWATGDWGLTRCACARHLRMHLCALEAPYGLIIRMPPCDGSYPDDTPAVSCTTYLQDPTP